MYVINTALNSLILWSKTRALHDFNLNLTHREKEEEIYTYADRNRQFCNIQLCEHQLNTSCPCLERGNFNLFKEIKQHIELNSSVYKACI